MPLTKWMSRMKNIPGFRHGTVRSSFVGLDCVSLPRHFSGAAYYIYYLSRFLLTSERTFPIALFCKTHHVPLFASLLKPTDKLIPIAIKNRVQQLYFYEYLLPDLLIRENVSLFHATHYLNPPSLPRFKTITTFHDMGFLLHPQNYPFLKRFYFGKRMRTFLTRSDLILAVSYTTADSIASLFPEVTTKVHVVYPGTDHLVGAYEESRSPLPVQQPFMLAVNTFQKHKNVPFLIEVFNRLREKYNISLRFVIIGHPANSTREIFEARNCSKFKRDIHIQNSIPTSVLISYYRQAEFFVNASSFEGFGFTPLEALRSGIPAFIYRNQAVAELLGFHPYLISHLNVDDWARFISREYWQGFPNKLNAGRIADLSWQVCAERTIKKYEMLVKINELKPVS